MPEHSLHSPLPLGRSHARREHDPRQPGTLGLTDRKLIVTFGANGPDLGAVAAKSETTWEEFAEFLTKRPPETNDKASRGWFCPAEFANRRHSDDFIARHALTLDHDVVTPAQVKKVLLSIKDFASAVYTTGSHTVEKPRVRVVMPTSRPMSADEFCAVSRYIAALADIELAARESHVAAQMSFQPTVKPGAPFKGRVNSGKWIDVDEVLATYLNWRDRTSWPKRKEHDEQYSTDELPDPPTSKPGVIGAFCRAFSISQAIDKFQLPFERVS